MPLKWINGIPIWSDIVVWFRNNHVLDRWLLQGQKDPRYWSIGSIGRPELQHLHGSALCKQVTLGYIASVRNLAQVKKDWMSPWVYVVSAGNPKLHYHIKWYSWGQEKSDASKGLWASVALRYWNAQLRYRKKDCNTSIGPPYIIPIKSVKFILIRRQS